MEKKRIALEAYPRREHFLYFKSMNYPYVGVTVEVDITEFMQQRRAAGEPFFLNFLYAVLRAGNHIPEFRRRIEDDGIVEYAYSKASCVVMKEDETYAYCTLDGRLPREAFLREGKQAMEAAKRGGDITESEEAASYFFVTCLPWLHYSNLLQPVPTPPDSNVRISWGKFVERDGRITLPVSVMAHHALVDGLHLGRFYELLELEISDLSN